MVEFVEKWKSDIVAFLTMHSYSQYILTAYGYTKELPESYNETASHAFLSLYCIFVGMEQKYLENEF